MIHQVPSVGSKGFVQRLKEVQPDVPIRLDLPTGDHMFDVDMTSKTDWVKDGTLFLGRYWQ